MKYDFSGYATRNDLRCSDGRTIRRDAFKECDGVEVPLVWQHMHDSPGNVLGHALLENRADGVYAYGTFNNTPSGLEAKELVKHGDIKSLSIYANRLKQVGGDVTHGVIREVSLVLSGANPQALIDNVAISHSDGDYEVIDDEAVIYSGDYLSHADDPEEEDDDMAKQSEETIEDVFNTLSEKQKQAVYAIVGAALEEQDKPVQHADDDMDDEDDEEETIEDVFNTLSEKQKQAVYAIVGAALEEQGGEVSHSDEEGYIMHNVFETGQDAGEVLSHAEIEAIFTDAKRGGSLKDAVLAHGITNIQAFFPEDQLAPNQPGIIGRNMEWVTTVLNGVHKTPFSKVKSTAANLTADEARAKGYLNKGTQKQEEQLAALKRSVSPTTIYKLQKLDRDDVVDITDFDVVAWIKEEMRTMLNEEVARAILVGDGRSNISNDKIDETKIIPIWSDDEVYSVHTRVVKGADYAKDFIDAAIRARKNYKGSGSPTLFVGPGLLTEMRLIRDEIGHRLYKNDQELADELRVSKIVEVELLDNLTRTVSGTTYEYGGIIVNLNDYNVGATKGGEVNLFDDFDLDYNKYEYLIETRMSGALTQPKSALVIEFTAATSGGNGGDNSGEQHS